MRKRHEGNREGEQVSMSLWDSVGKVRASLNQLMMAGVTTGSAEVSHRKWQLFGVACCRLFWDWIEDPPSRYVVEVGEAFADGKATSEELGKASGLAFANRDDLQHGSRTEAEAILCFPAVIDYDAQDFHTHPADLAEQTVGDVVAYVERLTQAAGYPDQQRLPKRLADCLRDIIGNPFRPVAFDPRWRTEHTLGIAEKMYDDRDFAAMPILADALEEAGCEDADILTHCREPGTHARGCWVVDLVLGKE